MNSRAFGPPTWSTLFYVAAGYDLNDTPKAVKDPQYKSFFASIGNVLPCRKCRESYNKFFHALDIQRYMDLPRCGLIKFVYDVKNFTNQKLARQEARGLKETYQQLRRYKSPETDDFWEEVRRTVKHVTKDSPSFESVVERLMKERAECAIHMEACKVPFRNFDFPPVPEFSQVYTDENGDLDHVLYAGKGRKRKSKRLKKSKSRRKRSLSRRPAR